MGNVACCDHSRPCCALVIPDESSVESGRITALGTRSAIRTSQRPPTDSPHTPEANSNSPDQNGQQMGNREATGPAPQVTHHENDMSGAVVPTDGTALQQWVSGAGLLVSKGTCVLCGKLVFLKHAKFRWEDGQYIMLNRPENVTFGLVQVMCIGSVTRNGSRRFQLQAICWITMSSMTTSDWRSAYDNNSLFSLGSVD